MDIEDIEFLRGLGFSWTRIAQVIGISRSTLYRRLEEEGVPTSVWYTQMSDVDLDRVIQQLKRDHPNDGERLIRGRLIGQGIHVPRTRTRASIHRIDPINTQLRRSVTVRRRVYYAAGPNAVWHIDGHHKLIRWRFVIHGGIDGYSRTIVYLHCADNNRANSVMNTFTNAVAIHGLPNRIRSDLGGENIDVWQFMIEQHSCMSAVITGSSTHNERIERLWRDVYRCVGVLFADTFRQLEDEGLLDPLNEVDLFCLHFVYLPRINRALNEFVESWNNHSISTAGNLTPNQLFIRGALEQGTIPQQPTPPAGNTTLPLHRDRVAVPRLLLQPCHALQVHLADVNPLAASDDFGYSLYNHVVNIVGLHLMHSCDLCSL